MIGPFNPRRDASSTVQRRFRAAVENPQFRRVGGERHPSPIPLRHRAPPALPLVSRPWAYRAVIRGTFRDAARSPASIAPSGIGASGMNSAGNGSNAVGTACGGTSAAGGGIEGAEPDWRATSPPTSSFSRVLGVPRVPALATSWPVTVFRGSSLEPIASESRVPWVPRHRRFASARRSDRATRARGSLRRATYPPLLHHPWGHDLFKSNASGRNGYRRADGARNVARKKLCTALIA